MVVAAWEHEKLTNHQQNIPEPGATSVRGGVSKSRLELCQYAYQCQVWLCVMSLRVFAWSQISTVVPQVWYVCLVWLEIVETYYVSLLTLADS